MKGYTKTNCSSASIASTFGVKLYLHILQCTGEIASTKLHMYIAVGPQSEKTCLRSLRTTNAHAGRLISAFVNRFLESIISNLDTGKSSIFWLVSVAEETGLRLTLSETSKTGFDATRPK